MHIFLNNEDNLIIEKEYYVFFNCPRCDDIRRNYLFNWFTGPIEVIYFYNIMSSDDENLFATLRYNNILYNNNNNFILRRLHLDIQSTIQNISYFQMALNNTK